MPEIRPTSTNLPRDWRNAWAAFQRMRSIGRALCEPVETWTLEYPSKAKKLVDRRWFVTYTFQGKNYTAYLGISGTTSVQTLNDIAKSLAAILEGRRAESRARPKITPRKETKKDPIYDDNLVAKLWSEWQLQIAKIRSSQQLRIFEEDNEFLVWFMKRKAGILDMRMSEYLTNHPHARYGWITPPRTREEYDRRQRAYEDLIRRQESRRHYD